MQQRQRAAEVQEAGLRALEDLAADEEFRVAIARIGGIGVILSTIRRHRKLAAVVEQGLRTLRRLATNQKNQAEIAHQGGIQLTLNMLRKYKASPAVVEVGLWVVLNLASCAENRLPIVAAGGVDILLSALARHSANVAVVEKGLWALLNISAECQNRQIIALGGGLEQIISAMEAHQSSSELIFYGLSALINLCSDPATCTRFAGYRGTNITLELLEQHITCDKVVAPGLGLLRLLRTLASVTPEQDESAVGLVTRAIQTHIHSVLVIERGILYLWHAAKAGTLPLIEGATNAILAVVQRFPRHEQIVEVCLWLLGNMFKADEKCLAASSSRAVVIVVDILCTAMCQRIRSSKIVEQAFWALRNLPKIEDCVAVKNFDPIAADAITLFIAALHAHPLSAGVSEQGIGVLWKIAVGSTTKLAIAAQGLDAVLTALDNHRGSPEVMEQGFGLLRSLAAEEGNRQFLAQCGAVKIVLHGLEHHSEDSAVTVQGLAFLRNIAAVAQEVRVSDEILAGLRRVKGNSSFNELESFVAPLDETAIENFRNDRCPKEHAVSASVLKFFWCRACKNFFSGSDGVSVSGCPLCKFHICTLCRHRIIHGTHRFGPSVVLDVLGN